MTYCWQVATANNIIFVLYEAQDVILIKDYFRFCRIQLNVVSLE